MLGRSGLERLAQRLEPRAFSRYIEAEVTIGIRRESVPRLRERPQRAHAVSPAEVMETHTHLNQRLKEAARWAAHTNPDALERLVTLEEAAAVELAHGPPQGNPIVAQKLRLGNSIILRGRDAPAEVDDAYATLRGKLVAIGAVEAGMFKPRRVFPA